MKTHDMGNVKTIVCFDNYTPEQQEHFGKLGIKIRSYNEILTIGSQNRKDFKA